MSFVRKENAVIFLVINAVLWGSSYIWSKLLLDFLPRFPILFLCSLGGLIATFILFPKGLKGIKLAVFLPVIAVSLLSIASNTFFMLALQYTSSSNTAFIVQTSVLITPVMMALLERKKLEARMICCAGAALCGMFLLTCDTGCFAFNLGDLLALCNALFFSAFLVGIKLVCSKTDPVHFSIVHQSTCTIGFLILSLVSGTGALSLPVLYNPVFLLLLTASVFASASTVLLQSAALKHVRPEKATIIYTIEPVAAMLLAFSIIGERFKGWEAGVGCLMILFSVTASIYKRPIRIFRRNKATAPKINGVIPEN